jgi:putative chitinase
MKRDVIEWVVILKDCGVKAAQIDVWAPIFADVVGPETFSQGDAELPSFLGQVLHESGMLTCMEENLNYSAARIRQLGMASPAGSRWRSLVIQADELGGNPVKFANAVYGGRLGNTEPNDGWMFRGSGPIQCTGRSNFAELERITGIPLTRNPDLLRQPGPEALRVCIAWWEGHVPDGIMGSVQQVTKAVNGGSNGLDDRINLTIKAKAALG